MPIDVEASKREYLSQWSHCHGKGITAVDSALVCDCGARFPWKDTLGESIELALNLEWLSPNGDSAESNRTATSDQMGMF